MLVFGHREETQCLRHEERLRKSQGNRGQAGEHNAEDFELEDPDGVEKEGCLSSIASDWAIVSCTAPKIEEEEDV